MLIQKLTVDSSQSTGFTVYASRVSVHSVDSSPIPTSRQSVTVDSRTVDSGTVDSGTVDSGTVDSGTVDSGTVDRVHSRTCELQRL
jgi:hypothetical protein